VLEAQQKIGKKGYLSEGEKRAARLAGFLDGVGMIERGRGPGIGIVATTRFFRLTMPGSSAGGEKLAKESVPDDRLLSFTHNLFFTSGLGGRQENEGRVGTNGSQAWRRPV